MKNHFLTVSQGRGVRMGVRDGLEASSDQYPNLLCSGRITGIMPRFRLTLLQIFACGVYVDRARLPDTMGEAMLATFLWN